MKTIEEYAIELVVDGAESCAEDDTNEGEEIADEDHKAATDLALDIARAIKNNPQAALALAGHVGPCDAALLPLGSAPVAPCVKRIGHGGLHQTQRGVGWADPDDGEG